ncbi:MAG: hypothetical protein JW914_07170 [Syntrophaceae bacterium]|nr:hypothetical protein [Syntrophaceae bacterium]
MLTEEKIFVENGKLIIEALRHKSASAKGVIVCHPHPLMGGSMRNNVVEAIVRAFAAEDFTTVRFNFRGVGASTGSYDEGRGETQDIISVYEYLKKEGLSQIYFTGYSFGAWVGAKLLDEEENRFSYTTFISPPNNHFPFNINKLKNIVDLIVCGDTDDYCKINNIISQLNEEKTAVEIISEADHFYWGKEHEIEKILRQYLKKIDKNN